MKRRNYLFAALLFLCVLTGCQTQKQTETEEKHGDEREPLVLWSYFETQAQRKGLDTLVRGFNQSQNQYELSWEYIPMTGFNTSLSSAFTENKLPDMAILDNPDMPMMIQLGMFEEITEQELVWNIEEECYPATVKTAMYDGKFYGIPFDCNNTALIYNKDFLEEKGAQPPSTWEELHETAKLLTDGTRSGFLLSGIEAEQGAFQLLSWILAAGENPEKLGGEKTVKAFAFLQEMLSDGSLSETCINLTQTDVALRFIEGKTAMMQNGPWVFPMLDEAGISYGVVPLPAGEAGGAVTGGENIGILKGKNVEGSLAFLRYCMKDRQLYEFCRTSGVLPAKMSLAGEYVKEEERMAVFEEQMGTAVTRTEIPAWSSVSQALTTGFYQIVAQEQTPEEAAQSLGQAQEK